MSVKYENLYKDILTHDILFVKKNVIILSFCERGQIEWSFENVSKNW